MPKNISKSGETFPSAEAYLIVDGYNAIGAIRELSGLAGNDFDAARDRLIDWLADYGGRTNQKVIAVFDAHHVRDGRGMHYDSGKVDVRFTKSNESADEWIERMVASILGDLRLKASDDPLAASGRPRVTVATSDQLQQHLVFGYGALRMPVSELESLIRNTRQDTGRQLRNSKPVRNPMGDRLPSDVLAKLDQMRKG